MYWGRESTISGENFLPLPPRLLPPFPLEQGQKLNPSGIPHYTGL